MKLLLVPCLFILGFAGAQQTELIYPKVYSAKFSPDGKKLVTSSEGSVAYIWDVATGKLLLHLNSEASAIFYAAFSPDGKSIVTVSGDKTAIIWNADNGSMQAELKGPGFSRWVSFSPDSKYVLAVCTDGFANIWDAKSGKLSMKTEDSVSAAVYSKDGKFIITASNFDGTYKKRDASTGKLIRQLKSVGGLMNEDDYILDLNENYIVDRPYPQADPVIYDSAKNGSFIDAKLVSTLEGHTSFVNRASFRPDRELVVTASSDSTAKVWVVATGKLLLDLKGHNAAVFDAEFSPDGKYIVTASLDGETKLWNTANGSLVRTFKRNPYEANAFGYSKDDSSQASSLNNAFVTYKRPSEPNNFQQPELILPVAHSEALRTARFSKDQKYVVTGGYDKTANVWETLTGKKIHRLDQNSGVVNDAFFSNDNGYIAVCTDSSVNIWSSKSYSLIGKFYFIKKAIFSPDGRKLFLIRYDGLFQKYDLKSMKKDSECRNYAVNPDLDIRADNKEYCSYTNGVVYIRDMISDKILFEYIPTIMGEIRTVFFSQDGLYLLVILSRGIEKINLVTGSAKIIGFEEIRVFSVSKNHRYLLTGYNYLAPTFTEISRDSKLWDLQDNKMVSPLSAFTSVHDTTQVQQGDTILTVTGIAPYEFPKAFLSIAVSNDGNYIKIYDMIWSVRNIEKSYKLGGKDLHNTDVSDDSRFTLIQKKDGEINLWDIAEKRQALTYKSPSDVIKACDISSDGKKIAICSNKNARVLDLSTAHTLFELKHFSGIQSVAFNKDGTRLITHSDDSVARLWDVSTGGLLQSFSHHWFQANPCYFDAKDNLVEFKGDSVKISLYDINGDIRGDTSILDEIEFPENLRMNMSKTGRYWVSVDGLALIDSLQRKKILLPHIPSHVNAFSNNEKYLAIGGDNPDTLLIKDLETGKIVFAGKLDSIIKSRYRNGGIKQLLFSSDDKYLLAVDDNQEIHVLSTQSFETLLTIPGQRCSLTKDGKCLVVLNQGMCDIYNFQERQLLYSYISVDTLNYLVVDPQKRFDGTEGARKLLYFTCGSEIVGLDQVKDQLWVPNLAERLMKGETINSKALSELEICGLTPEVENISPKTGEYQFKITPRRGGLGEIVLSVNGNATNTYKPEQLKKSGIFYELVINKEELKNYLVKGTDNNVSIKAYTKDDDISSRSAEITAIDTTKKHILPNLYAVMVGVSEYKGNEMTLRYAAKDAQDLSNAVAMSAKRLLNTDSNQHVYIYNLNTGKNRDAFPEKKSIRQVFEAIGKKATANDILLIFFAGHGVMRGAGDNKQFYFLTADASLISSTDDLKNVGISTTELTEWIKPQNIRAQKRILIFDACNSGQAINDVAGKELAVRSDDKPQQIKAIDKLNQKSGLFILSASASDQSAYEMGRYSQGLLTYSLLSAIKKDPDILEEGKYLSVARWFDAAEKIVYKISKETGARQDPQIVSNTNFNIGIVDNEVTSRIILPDEKPVFAVSNFQNEDRGVGGDDLEISELLDQELKDISTRGTDANIDFIPRSNNSDTYSLKGTYEVKNNNVSVSANVWQNKNNIYRYQIKGNKESLNALISEIVKAAGNWVMNNKK